ncbi:MAG: hypothetical protein ACLSG5_10840 [Oscillospiraceae bacterium]
MLKLKDILAAANAKVAGRYGAGLYDLLMNASSVMSAWTLRKTAIASASRSTASTTGNALRALRA